MLTSLCELGSNDLLGSHASDVDLQVSDGQALEVHHAASLAGGVHQSLQNHRHVAAYPCAVHG